jgi:hypothetical protein
MTLFQGCFFLVFCLFLLYPDRRALHDGTLEYWGYGFGTRTEYSRSDQPIRYWLIFALYGIAGLWLVIFALRGLTGHSAPRPL